MPKAGHYGVMYLWGPGPAWYAGVSLGAGSQPMASLAPYALESMLTAAGTPTQAATRHRSKTGFAADRPRPADDLTVEPTRKRLIKLGEEEA